MSGAHYYCRPCDAWYRQAAGWRCPECGAELEERTFRYPEDVFGPPLEGEAPIADRDLRRETPGRERGSRARGMAILFMGHVFLLLVSMALQDGALMLFFVGVVQLVYAVPMMIWWGIKGQTVTVSGMALGAGLTFLLNATCFGIVCGSL